MAVFLHDSCSSKATDALTELVTFILQLKVHVRTALRWAPAREDSAASTASTHSRRMASALNSGANER